jgi:hypothetical protein
MTTTSSLKVKPSILEKIIPFLFYVMDKINLSRLLVRGVNEWEFIYYIYLAY